MKKTITKPENKETMKDLGGMLQSLLFSSKIDTENLKFLYNFIDKKSYGYKCFKFKNQKDFIEKLSPEYELGLWVDSLTTDGKTALNEYLIKTFGEDKLMAIYKENEEEMGRFMEDSMNEIKKPTIEEIKNTIERYPDLDLIIQCMEILKGKNEDSLIENAYWHKVPDQHKEIVLIYLEKEFPEIAKSIAKKILEAYGDLLKKKTT